jgi:hypothetical protein
MQWKSLPVPKALDGTDAIHYTTVYKVFSRWFDDGSLEQAFIASVGHLSAHNQLDLRILHGDGTNTVAKKGGDGIGYLGHKHQKGEKVIAIVDNNGYILAPLPVAPVNEADTVLLPGALQALKWIGKQTGLNFKQAPCGRPIRLAPRIPRSPSHSGSDIHVMLANSFRAMVTQIVDSTSGAHSGYDHPRGLSTLPVPQV